jgi:hypothetical protein
MQEQLQHLLEKDRTIDTINQLFIGTDARDWPTCRPASPTMSTLTRVARGGSASQLTPAQMAAGWKEDLRPP